MKWTILFVLLLAVVALLAPMSVHGFDDEDDGDIDDVTFQDGEEIDLSSFADDDDEDDDNDIEQVSNIDVTLIFAGGEKSFVAGQPVHSVIGFTNKGETDLTVMGAMGSFRYKDDFSYHIQNFSNVAYDINVKSKEQATFDFHFVPSSGIYQSEFGLVIELVYKDDETSQQLAAPAFNQTVEVVEATSTIDGEFFGLIGMFSVAIFGIIYLVVNKCFKKQMKRKTYSARSKVETGTKASADANWLEGTNAVASKKRNKKLE